MAGRSASRNTRRTTLAVTMQDVARHAGVSTMTVSNLLSGRKPVGDEARAAIETAIHLLGYVPNLAARSLASGAPLRIGLHLPDFDHGYLSSLVLGVVDATSRLGAQLIVEKWKLSEPNGGHDALQRLKRSGAQAVLIAPSFGERLTEAEVAALAPLRLITLSPGRALPHLPSIRIDDRQAAFDVTRHLTHLGHRRIAHIQGPPSHSSSASRRAGYEAALSQAGLDADPALVVQGDFTFDGGLTAMTDLLDSDAAPTAVFAANDDMAAAAVAVAQARGLRVPEDVSIAGFDGSPLAVRVQPKLTTLLQPVSRMADEAITALVGALTAAARNPSAPAVVLADRIAPHALIARGSTGPAPSVSRPIRS